MKTYLVSLGSNVDREENMSRCRLLLRGYFSDITYSQMLETEPFGDDFTTMFYNQLAIINSDFDYEFVKHKLKSIEAELGRKSTDKSQGVVKMDLDVLAIDHQIIKRHDFERPYLNVLLHSFRELRPSVFYSEYLKACI